MRILNLLAATALSLTATAPAFAEGHMMKQGAQPAATMHMSTADARRMKNCNAMTHARMMRSATCRRLVQMHPDMMHHDTMKAPDAMGSENKM